MVPRRRASIGWSPGRRRSCSVVSRRSPTGWMRRCRRPPAGTTARRGTTPTSTSSASARSASTRTAAFGRCSPPRAPEHFPDDDSVDLAAPSFEMTDPGTARLAVTADAGTVSGDRETVTLRGNVRATRDAVRHDRARPRSDGARDLHHRTAADHPEGRARGNRPAGDDRGAAWNNPRRRHGPRQQRAHDQAQVGRARNTATQLAAEVIPPRLFRLRSAPRCPHGGGIRRARHDARGRGAGMGGEGGPREADQLLGRHRRCRPAGARRRARPAT